MGYKSCPERGGFTWSTSGVLGDVEQLGPARGTYVHFLEFAIHCALVPDDGLVRAVAGQPLERLTSS